MRKITFLLIVILWSYPAFAARQSLPQASAGSPQSINAINALIEANTIELYNARIVSGSFNGTDLRLTTAGGSTITIDASTVFDNTDGQTITTLSLNPTSHVLTVTLSGGNTATVDLSGLVGGGLADAPSDGTTYCRQDETWVACGSSAAADDTAYNATSWNNNTDAATKNAIRDKIEAMTGEQIQTMDCSGDDLVATLFNNTTIVATDACVNDGGLADAPSDGSTYGRKDGAWAAVGTGTGEENVQVDWNVSDTESDAYIKNKPTTITAQQASDISINNAKVSFDSTSSTRLANTSGTNTGDNATNTQYSGLLTSKTAKYVYAAPNGAAGAPTFRALVASDIPTLNQNTSGTAANLSGTPALPNGTTATTQTVGDNTTKLATTAFVKAATDAVSGVTINDSAGNGDTTVVWSADKTYDELANKVSTSSAVTVGTEVDSFLRAANGTLLSTLGAQAALTNPVVQANFGTGVYTFLGTPSASNFFSALTGEGAFAATLFGYADAAAVRTGIGAQAALTIISGTKSLLTTSLAANTCRTETVTSQTGVASTDVISGNFNATVIGATGYGAATTPGIVIYAYGTANTVNFDVCNTTASAITPSARTLNWQIIK
jgi:hypothetical protein